MSLIGTNFRPFRAKNLTSENKNSMVKRKASTTIPPNHASKQACADNYGSSDYWENRYAVDSDNRNHCWYYTYAELSPLLEHFLSNNQSVFEVGCGDVPLGEGILAGDSNPEADTEADTEAKRRVVCCDISPTVIKEMCKKSSSSVQYVVADATKLSYADEEFDVVIGE